MLNEWNIMWYIYYDMNYLYLIILSSLLNINKNTEIFLKIVCLDITLKVYFMLGISYNIFLVSAMFDFVLGFWGGFLFAKYKIRIGISLGVARRAQVLCKALLLKN